MKNEKKIKKKLLKYIEEIIAVIILIIAFFIINKEIDKRNAIDNRDAKEYNYSNDYIRIEDGKVVLEGWCYRMKRNTPKIESEESEKFSVILFDESAEIKNLEDLEKASVYLSTVRGENSVVNKTYGAYEDYQYDYAASGYTAWIELSQLDMSNKDYVVAYRYGDSDNHLIRTSVHIKDYLDE